MVSLVIYIYHGQKKNTILQLADIFVFAFLPATE
jgi:hypothetical protein